MAKSENFGQGLSENKDHRPLSPESFGLVIEKINGTLEFFRRQNKLPEYLVGKDFGFISQIIAKSHFAINSQTGRIEIINSQEIEKEIPENFKKYDFAEYEKSVLQLLNNCLLLKFGDGLKGDYLQHPKSAEVSDKKSSQEKKFAYLVFGLARAVYAIRAHNPNFDSFHKFCMPIVDSIVLFDAVKKFGCDAIAYIYKFCKYFI